MSSWASPVHKRPQLYIVSIKGDLNKTAFTDNKKNPHFNATSVKKQDGKEVVHFTAPFFSLTVYPLWSHTAAFPRGFGSLRARICVWASNVCVDCFCLPFSNYSPPLTVPSQISVLFLSSNSFLSVFLRLFRVGAHRGYASFSQSCVLVWQPTLLQGLVFV